MKYSFDLDTLSIDREFYIEKFFTEEFGFPKASLGPSHKYVGKLAQLILMTAKVSESLGMRLGTKAWESI